MVTNRGRIVLYCIVDVQGRIADVDVDVDVDLNVDVAEAVEHLPSSTKQPDNQAYLFDSLAYPVPDTCRCLSPALLFIHAYMKWHLSATNPSSNPGA